MVVLLICGDELLSIRIPKFAALLRSVQPIMVGDEFVM